jgi:hypothetical protein
MRRITSCCIYFTQSVKTNTTSFSLFIRNFELIPSIDQIIEYEYKFFISNSRPETLKINHVVIEIFVDKTLTS